MAATTSLRSSFVWTFAGNALYAVGQWAVLSLIAKLGSGEMLGEYALAVAMSAPVVMLSHLNLRAVLATDSSEKHSFRDYLAVRLWVSAASLLVIAGLAVAGSNSPALAALILAAGAAQSAENLSDIYYGALQRRERMDTVAKSMIVRAALSVGALGVVLWLTRRILAAVIALALGRITVLLLYDRPAGQAGEQRTPSAGWRAQVSIFRTTLPLGIVLMLTSLNSNIPRYVIERELGARALGAFAAVASFVTAGSTVLNALGQAAMARLARHFQDRDWAPGQRLIAQLLALALALGTAGVACAALLGKYALRILYRPEYETYNGLLVAVMAASIPVYLAGMLGYVITSARAFDMQLPLFATVTASCFVAAWILVPRFGLYGGPMALAVAAAVQIGGELLILIRVPRRQKVAG